MLQGTDLKLIGTQGLSFAALITTPPPPCDIPLDRRLCISRQWCKKFL